MEAADLVDAAMGAPGAALLVALVEKEAEALDAKLDAGPLDHVEYAYLHGRRSGLRYFEQVAEALRAKADDRLEEQRRKHEDPDGSGR